MKSCAALILASLAVLSPAAFGRDRPMLVLVRTIPLPEVKGRIDHLALDRENHRLFVAAFGNNSVEVVDLDSGRCIHSITGVAAPQCVLYLPADRTLAVTSSGTGTCDVYDGATYRKISTARIGDDADNMQYDGAEHDILIGYGSGGLAALDEHSGLRIGDSRLSAHPEGFLLERSGRRVFINVPRHRNVVVLERPRFARIGAIALDGAGRNYPLAMDEAHHRLFTCLRNPGRLAVMNTETLRQIGSIRIADDADNLHFDSARGLLFASCGRGFIDVVSQVDADHYVLQAQIRTAWGARTSVFSQESGLLYLAVPRSRGQRAEIRVYQYRP